MTSVLSQTHCHTGDHNTMVTALSGGTICVDFQAHGNGYISVGRQLTIEDATRLRDMLTEALALYAPSASATSEADYDAGREYEGAMQPMEPTNV